MKLQNIFFSYLPPFFKVIGRTAELLEASQEQKKAYKDGLEKKKVQIIQLEKAFKSTSQEVLKVRWLHTYRSILN